MPTPLVHEIAQQVVAAMAERRALPVSLARSAQSGDARAEANTSDRSVEAMRVLRVARFSAPNPIVALLQS